MGLMSRYIFKINPDYSKVKREVSICLLAFIEYRLKIRYKGLLLTENRSSYLIIKDLSDWEISNLNSIFMFSKGKGVIDDTFTKLPFFVGKAIDLEYPDNVSSVKDRNHVLVHSWFYQIMQQHKPDSFNSLQNFTFESMISHMGLKDLFD